FRLPAGLLEPLVLLRKLELSVPDLLLAVEEVEGPALEHLPVLLELLSLRGDGRVRGGLGDPPHLLAVPVPLCLDVRESGLQPLELRGPRALTVLEVPSGGRRLLLEGLLPLPELGLPLLERPREVLQDRLVGARGGGRPGGPSEVGLRGGERRLPPRDLLRLDRPLRDRDEAHPVAVEGRRAVLPEEDALAVLQPLGREGREEFAELDDAILLDDELSRVSALCVEDEHLLHVGLHAGFRRDRHGPASGDSLAYGISASADITPSP